MVIAWACASLLLLTAVSAYALLAYTLDTAAAEAALFEERLRANAMPPAQWRDRLAAAFALSLLQSLVIIDGIKAATLAFTSPPAINQLIAPKSHGAKAIRKVLSRLHRVLDVVL